MSVKLCHLLQINHVPIATIVDYYRYYNTISASGVGSTGAEGQLPPQVSDCRGIAPPSLTDLVFEINQMFDAENSVKYTPQSRGDLRRF